MIYLFYVCISLSMAGSALMLTHIFFFDNLRLFAMRIVACLSISDSVYALGLLLYVEPQPGYNQVRCSIQGAITQFATISAFVWSASISYFIYISITKGQKGLEAFEKYQKLIFIVGFFIPLLMAIVPLFFASYSPTPQLKPATCSINSNDEKKSIEQNRALSLYLNLWLFYFPLILSVIISIFYIMKTYCKIKKIRSEYELLAKKLNIQLSFLRNLLLYPAALFICWLPSQIVFFIYIFNEDWINKIQKDYFESDQGIYSFIRSIQYGSSFLQGFFNSLVYLFNSYQVRKKLNSLERLNMDKQKTQTLFSNNNEDSIRSSQISNSFENLQDI